MMRKGIISAASIGMLLVFWYFASVSNPSMFPHPATVFSLSVQLLFEGDISGDTGLYHLGVTFYRILIITTVVLILSIIIGILMGTKPALENPLQAVLPVWLTAPSVVVVLFAMILFNFSTTSVLVAVTFVALPFGIVNVYQGTKSVNSDLIEMASVFELDQRAIWRNIYIPSLFPYLFASSRYLLGMIWKVVLLAETFGVSTGVGSMIRFWYHQGEIAYLLGYFMMFAVTILAIEYLILAPLERKSFAYRSKPN